MPGGQARVCFRLRRTCCGAGCGARFQDNPPLILIFLLNDRFRKRLLFYRRISKKQDRTGEAPGASKKKGGYSFYYPYNIDEFYYKTQKTILI